MYRFGASSLVISKQMPAICKLLSDPTSKVSKDVVVTSDTQPSPFTVSLTVHVSIVFAKSFS